MKYFLVAGEASGDLHAANLMKQVVAHDENPHFEYWGGDRMQAQGGVLHKHYRELAFMGFVQVLLNLRTILGNIKKCKAQILAFKPDVLVLIDYPGFNMRIAEFAKKEGIKVVYYVSPQIWAWKQNRVYKLKRDVDRMLCILPFEKDFYRKFDVEVDFVGHPLIDAIAGRPKRPSESVKESLGLNPAKKVIALLPGSRSQEIQKMLPVMVEAAQKFPDYQLVLAAAPSQSTEFYKKVANLSSLHIVAGKTYDLFEVADAAMVTSGTATLEAALFNVPEVVCYKSDPISVWIARRLIKVKYISLVNLIADKEVVKELIQSDLNPVSLERELKKCLENSIYFKEEFSAISKLLGGGGASLRAAQIVIKEAKG